METINKRKAYNRRFKSNEANLAMNGRRTAEEAVIEPESVRNSHDRWLAGVRVESRTS